MAYIGKPVRRASQYQVALRPDEVNSKVHEMSALNMNRDTEIIQNPLSTTKEYTRGSLKSLIFFEIEELFLK